MNRWRCAVLFFFGLLVLIPGTATAQDADGADGFVLHVNRTITIGPTEVVEGVVAISGDAVVDGHITGTLWVIDGVATVNGTVDDDVMVINGTLELGATATVNNVSLVRSDLVRDPAATITGSLSERAEFFAFGWAGAIFSFLFWIGMTLVVILAGLVFVALGRPQLAGAGGLITGRPVESIVTALLLWIGVPILAVLALVSLIGIPLGLALFLVVLPTLWLLGYLIAGARLGDELLGRLGQPDDAKRAYLAVILGVLAFQLIGLVPIIGGLIVGLAGFIGSGALIFLVYRNRRGERKRPPVATTQEQESTA